MVGTRNKLGAGKYTSPEKYQIGLTERRGIKNAVGSIAIFPVPKLVQASIKSDRSIFTDMTLKALTIITDMLDNSVGKIVRETEHFTKAAFNT